MSAEEPTTLSAELERHNFGRGWCYACGALWYSDREPPHQPKHVAQVVLAWIAERMTDPATVEAVSDAMQRTAAGDLLFDGSELDTSLADLVTREVLAAALTALGAS